MPDQSTTSRSRDDFRRCLALVEQVCALAGSPNLIENARRSLTRAGVIEAVRRHEDEPLLDWLLEVTSYQGIADAVALSYLERHGRPQGDEIAAHLTGPPSCPKLSSYWAFAGCGYQKISRTCAEPEHLAGCPLPRADLRNGRLSQAAYSLALFFRDIAGGNFVRWIDQRLQQASAASKGVDRPAQLRGALLEPLRQVHGLSDKVLSMALSDLLLAANPDRSLWVETGASLIAVDTLVHNWLHRTEILRRLGREHPYGPSCHGRNGCALLIGQFAQRIDARQLNPDYPAFFPRLVQKAIWAFCAKRQLDLCNGNRIDDRTRCLRCACPLFDRCERVPLHPTPRRIATART